MKRYTLSLTCILLGLFFCNAIYAQGWMPVGPDDSNKAVCTGVDVFMTVNNRTDDVFASFGDPLAGTKATVRKYNGTSWSTVGYRGVTPNGLRPYVVNAMAIDDSSNIYIIYADSSHGNKASVQQYNSTGWHVLGALGFSNASITVLPFDLTSITVDTNNEPYVIYSDSSYSNKATVKRYHGGIWQTVGTEGFSTGSISSPIIKIDRKTNLPFVAYNDFAYSGKIAIMKFNGTSWVYPGPPAASDVATSNKEIAIDSNGVPYVAYTDGYFNYNVKTLSGGSWITLGGSGFALSTSTNQLPFTISPSGTLLIFSQNQLLRYNGTMWVKWGDTVNINSHKISAGNLSCSNDGNVYVGLYGNNEQFFAYRFDGSNWQRLDTGGITPKYPAKDATIATDTNGTPYAAYINDNRMHVTTFSGGTWNEMNTGLSGTNETQYTTCNLAVNKLTNELYINYIDTIGKAVVKKFNGGSWVDVGASPFLADTISSATLAISPAGNPYIAFVKTATSKLSVMKYDGSSWTNVGTPDFSDKLSLFPEIGMSNLAIGSDGNVFIGYINNRGTLVFEKYDGTNWSIAGDTLRPYSSRHFTIPLLAVNRYGSPYMGFTTSDNIHYNNDTVYIKKLKDNSWQSVGYPLYTEMDILLYSLIMDNTDRPVIAYRRSGSSLFSTNSSFFAPASVERYNDTDWEYIGDMYATPGDAYLPKLSLTKNNTLYCAYINANEESGGDLFVKKFINIPTDTTLNIKAITANDKTLSLYPNPCTSYVTIKGWDAAKDGDQLYIYDVSGRLIYLLKLRSALINTSSWPPGIYFIKTESNKTAELIKN